MSTRSERVREVFARALERPGDERRAYVEEACGGDPQLLAEVTAFLDALDGAAQASFLGSPTGGGTASGPAPAAEGEEPGAVIDRYKLLQVIGEGGFGTVYMAEQEHPVRRKVALKIIKLGMDTAQVIGRFEAERQALAMMDHPNIAKVLDAGATSSGRPYFIMELVRGIPITHYCDQNNLGMRERLELFIPVCNAVQHAHQKGVIHRDIKPNNVMVTLHDGKSVPKVIDFGIAKATDQRLTERTVFTEYRQFIGTPEYMSPEQAEMSGLDIDTRSDIYSLGVLLYELLTGTTPFDATTLRRAAFGEIQRIIREEEPPRPSTRLNTLGQALTAVAKHRHADAGQLHRLIRGDLDWIVMKCLEKDRTRRYETANSLATDIERHLSSQPVLAGPPSISYKLRKFVRRNRAAVASTLLVSVALVGGIIGTTWGMLAASVRRDEATRARDLAVTAQEQAELRREEAQRAQVAEQSSRELAESEAARSKAVTDYLVATLALADPEVALSPDMTVRAMLDRAAAEVRRTLEGQPRAEATVRTVIGRAYVSLGEPELAEPHLRRALEILDAQGNVAPADLYATLWPFVAVLFELQRYEISVVGPRAMEAGFQVVAETQPEMSLALRRLSEAVMSSGPMDVERQFHEASRLTMASLKPGDPLWLVVANNYFAGGMGLWYYRQDPAAEALFREALRIQRQELPELHPQVADIIELLVSVLNGTGRSAEAESLIRETIAIRRSVLPEGHWHVAASEISLAECLVKQGRFAEAEALLLGSRERITAAAGRQGTILQCIADLVDLYERWGKPEPAARYRSELARGLATVTFVDPSVARAAFGPEGAGLAAALEELTQIHASQADPASPPQALNQRARAALDPLLPQLAALRPDDPLAALAARDLAGYAASWSAWATGDIRNDMASAAHAVLQHWERDFPTELSFSLIERAQFSIDGGDLAAAEAAARQALQLMRGAQGEDSWMTALAAKPLGICLSRQGRYAEAEPLLAGSFTTLLAEPARHPGLAVVEMELLQEIHELYTRWGRPESTRPHTEKAIALYRRRAEAPAASAKTLNDYAWLLVSCHPAALRDAAAALPVAERAEAMSGGVNPAILDTLAMALFMTGDRTRAVEVQRQAVAVLSPGDSPRRRELEARLAEYEAAVNWPPQHNDGAREGAREKP